MLYAFIGQDAPDSLQRRLAARPAHLARVEALVAGGRIALAGPFPAVDAEQPGEAGFTGSLIVAEFPDLASATEWAAGDPYVTSDVFAAWEVRPFRQVFP